MGNSDKAASGGHLVWFRNDLRVADHPALHAAMTAAREEGSVVRAVFLPAIDQWRLHDWGLNKRDFVYRSVCALSEALAQLGVPLDLLDAPDFASAPQALTTYAQRHKLSHLWWHREVGWHERERDLAAKKASQQAGIQVHTLDDRFLVPPERVLTGNGTPYKVFTPFKRSWLAYLSESGAQPISVPKVLGSAIKPQTVAARHFDVQDAASDLASRWPAGEQIASKRLKAFAKNDLAHYHEQRDYPAIDGTSGLSPYLAVGVISARQCAQVWLNKADGDWHHPGLDVWLSELGWRDFYQYIMWHFPRVSRNLPFVEKTQHVHWRNDDKAFSSWCEGRTGIPIVDAAMRQLNTTGWMHNRLRMVVAMFLTKNLLIDWRWGEAYFMQTLVDADFAANNGGWQWSASTGTDAAPYFRVFNPVSQSQRFDPKGEFLRKWLPELAHLNDKQIHLPPANVRGDYPAPIVDLKASRQRAIDAFASL